jgi:FAD synthase
VEATWGGPDPLRPARRAGGVASLGVRPTFEPGDRVLEVNLFEVAEDLYGERLRVAFVRRQRAERRFASAAALIAQMERDAARARTILAARDIREWRGVSARGGTPDSGSAPTFGAGEVRSR